MALFSILHIGDVHLGRRTYDLIERIRDHAAVLPQIVAHKDALNLTPDLIVSTGDTFDNPNPDSFSEDAFARFAATINPSVGFHYIALTGNHDREKLDLGMTRVRSLGGSHVSPPGTYQFPIQGRWGTDGVRVNVKAFDWMPAAAIARELEAIEPGTIDILCIHQSVEGLMPLVGNPEVRLEQLRGKAAVVLAGDLHVNRTIDAGHGTTVVSAGSTVMCDSGEEPDKVVKLLTYDTHSQCLLETQDLPLQTRPILKQAVRNEGDLDAMRVFIAECPALYVVEFSPEMAHRIPEVKEWARVAGALFVDRTLARVEEGETFVESKETASREMEEIIAGRHPDERVRAAALSLWRNPGNLQTTCASLRT